LPNEKHIETEDQIIIFDGTCNLCNGLVKFILKVDKKQKFKFTSLQSERGQFLLKRFNLPADEHDSFVCIKDNRYYLKSSAVLLVLKELGGIWKWFYNFILIPNPFRDFLYNLVAKARHKIFGRQSECMVPTDDIKHRFLN
jgi:predicted DCC family thiol-disulfide oxidoreductase YuxK